MLLKNRGTFLKTQVGDDGGDCDDFKLFAHHRLNNAK